MKLSVMVLGWSAVLAPSAFAAEPKVTDPTAPSPSVTYRSAFADYKAFREEAIGDWRGLNDEVGRVGGHRGVMGGAGGHGGHGTAKPRTDVPVTTEGGQAPVRGAPKAPAGDAHSGH